MRAGAAAPSEGCCLGLRAGAAAPSEGCCLGLRAGAAAPSEATRARSASRPMFDERASMTRSIIVLGHPKAGRTSGIRAIRSWNVGPLMSACSHVCFGAHLVVGFPHTLPLLSPPWKPRPLTRAPKHSQPQFPEPPPFHQACQVLFPCARWHCWPPLNSVLLENIPAPKEPEAASPAASSSFLQPGVAASGHASCGPLCPSLATGLHVRSRSCRHLP